MLARKNQIYIGSLETPDYYVENDQISLCPTSQAVALVGQELSVDVFNPVVSDSEQNLLNVLHFRSSDGQEIQTDIGQIYAVDIDDIGTESEIINLEYGTPVWYYHEGELVGKFYIDTVKRQARNKYQLNCISTIGLLGKKMHGGDLFAATTFGAVLAHILAEGLHGSGNPVIDYVIDDDVASLPVSGWLPYASKRNNLYQLIFAYGVNIIKNYDGRPRFTFVYTGSGIEATEVDSSDVYIGGSIEYTKAYSKVSIAEHTYAAITEAEAETLFDNTSGSSVSNKEIWFDNAPVITSTLTASGTLTLVSATANSAVVSGKGTLTGIPYTHSMRTVSRVNPSATEEKTVNVEDCTMVNLINSENLLNRLYAFYCPSDYIKKISNEIIYGAERCGKMYQFTDPYGNTETAFLASMDITTSSVNKAGCEWYANYEPAGQAGLYQHVAILRPVWDDDEEEWVYEGDWEVPEGVTEFKAVLIGGGTGGGSGWPGANGEDSEGYADVERNADLSAVWFGAEGGEGGEGGAGGSPGKVKVVVISDATAGDTYHYILGEGGEGGAATGFIPDTVDELRAALENENPNTSYTDNQIQAMIAQEDTDWNGSPNTGTAGTATTMTAPDETEYSTDDNDAYTPNGGLYDPISSSFFAITGHKGIRGGKGGARQVVSNGSFYWTTDGENVVGDDGKVYRGGSTGLSLLSIYGLVEARDCMIAYGGNGAGAAVGIDRATHQHINGRSDQSTEWDVTEDDSYVE